MSDRRRLTAFVFVLAVVLSPGLSLAAGQRQERTPAAEGSAIERIFTWVERTWDSLTGSAPREHGPQLAGCGIDPNGTGCLIGGGGGGVTNSSGH
jgi:hypothetical protein